MQKRVLVAMSGGVDSSVAALLLQRQGYEVAGATFELFDGCSEDNTGDARRVCERLGIPHFVFDYRERFSKGVLDYFIHGYQNGETPNPCIACNKTIKFGAFSEDAERLGFDFISTGHYAGVRFDRQSGQFWLLRSQQERKDQSYVLYHLSQEQLSQLLLPIDRYSKAVRHPLTQLQCGINTYKVRVIRLKDNNADTLLEKMTQRQKNREHLDTSDFVQAVLAPLMSGSMPVKERILSTLRLLKRETANLNREEFDTLNAVLYAFAIKFLEHDDLLEVKEVLRMTVLGEMLWNDGYQGGYQDGYQGGELQHIISLICKKLKRGLEIPQIAQEVEEEISFVEKICQTAQLFASDYDAAKIAQELNKNSL